MGPAEDAAILRRLHDDPELLILVNVWDVASARVVAEQPGCRAIATASYSIAAAHGYADGEHIPVELMIATIERIAAAVPLPVTADLEAGYGDVAGTVRRAIDAGAVGGNLEDAMRPLPEAVAAVEATVRAGEAAGVPFVLNARTTRTCGPATGIRRPCWPTPCNAAGPSSTRAPPASSSRAG